MGRPKLIQDPDKENLNEITKKLNELSSLVVKCNELKSKQEYLKLIVQFYNVSYQHRHNLADQNS